MMDDYAQRCLTDGSEVVKHGLHVATLRSYRISNQTYPNQPNGFLSMDA